MKDTSDSETQDVQSGRTWSWLTSDTTLRVTALAIAVLGALLLLQSPNLGLDVMVGEMRRAGGSMSTDRYQALLASWMTTYRWLGAVLLGVGLWRALR